jgi:hypothetical protein
LEQGDVIAANSKFWDVDQYGMLDGTWFGGGDKYFGFRFRIRGEWRYAWARVRAPFDASSITVLDYAYEKTANTAITAGSGIATGAEAPALAGSPISMTLAGSTLLVRNAGQRDAELAVHDLLGRAMLQQRISGNASAVDVSALPRGVYFAIARNASGDVQVQKFQMLR